MGTRCYLFDIDGTIADGSHRLHHIQKSPKDWATYFSCVIDDAPIDHVVELACRLAMTGASIVYVSGRSDVCREQTAAWLASWGLPSGPLYMRKAGDHKNDDLLKIELLAEVRRDGFAPIMAFDDRNRVVAAWRAAGIPCAQVAEGDF
jgi:hypothetical protein